MGFECACGIVTHDIYVARRDTYVDKCVQFALRCMCGPEFMNVCVLDMFFCIVSAQVLCRGCTSEDHRAVPGPPASLSSEMQVFLILYLVVFSCGKHFAYTGFYYILVCEKLMHPFLRHMCSWICCRCLHADSHAAEARPLRPLRPERAPWKCWADVRSMYNYYVIRVSS